jgi:hypothetical protein
MLRSFNRKYDVPQSSHQRLMESDQVSEEVKRGLEAICILKANPPLAINTMSYDMITRR